MQERRAGRDVAPVAVDRVAALLAARGFAVTRVPVVVLPGAGSYVTYTNALFDRDSTAPVVYLPTYRVPELDAVAARVYASLGYRVVPIDVSTIYPLNGSLGCLVNVMARDRAD
jgi:non-ribosomal peptide synthetase component E (peptide arylation enzyme)